MKTFTKSFAILFMILLTVSCAKEEIVLPMEDEFSDQSALKKAIVIPDMCFSGTSNFDVYAPKEKKQILNGDEIFLLMFATLSYDEVEGTYLLTTQEWMPKLENGNLVPDFKTREVVFPVKITKGGAVKFNWPEEWWEIDPKEYDDVIAQVNDHTGCEIKGPGINKRTLMYTGHFDGSTFNVNCHFTGMQVSVPSMPFYWNGKNPDEDQPPYILGPVKFNFSMSMTVVNCPVFPEPLEE